MPLANPFFHRGPIRDRAYFFGRERLVKRALAFLTEGQSVALVGPRRVGKTSFLFHLMDSVVQQSHVPSAHLRCCYLDGGAWGQTSAQHVYSRLARAAHERLAGDGGAASEARDVEESAFATLEGVVRQAAARGIQLVFMIDEFETVAVNPHLDNDFFAGLRALAMEHRLAFVTVSTRPLLELTYARVRARSSPFFNFFAPIPIGLFARPESLGLLGDLSARGGAPFTHPFCEQLIAVAGDHPFFLQMIGDYAFDQVVGGEPQSAALTQALLNGPFGDEAVDHWNTLWSRLDPKDQRLMALFPVLAPSQPERVRRLEAAGLVTRASDGNLSLSGSGWRTFVSSQTVEGLEQAPPVTMDPALRVALLRGRPLRLSPQQFDLLSYLVTHRARVVKREELAMAVWQRADANSLDSLRVALKLLREALGEDQSCLHTIHGHGFQFLIADQGITSLPSAGGEE